MNVQDLIKEAGTIQSELTAIRRELHRHPEVGFELTYTKAFVKQKLEEFGYQPVELGKAGLIALVGGKTPGKTILLRADMDALPIQEEADVDYRSENDGKMHGCGHDMHTAMLLGAAKLLKAHEDEICGTVKLEFQPAEEIFQGSPDMLKAGLLENPHVDAAVMIHVTAGMPLPSGTIMVSGGGISSTSCEQYHIIVKGKGGHGSTPHEAIDPITAAAHIHIALQEINSRELDGNQFGIFTTGRFEAGKTSNVIPDTAEMWGTIRTTNPENEVGSLIKTRMKQICEGIGAAFRCETAVEFYDYCPCMVIEPELAADTLRYMKDLFGDGAIDLSVISGGKAGGGSEDFAFVSHRVPTVSMFLTAGSSKDGYQYSQHHPKVRFDDSVLSRGSAAYAFAALSWLNEHCG
ncbi:MAG: amidohydrolase [Oscillospiraceae bacterium]|nr:amidohydrolase [Oscillospiraceae bacterium]